MVADRIRAGRLPGLREEVKMSTKELVVELRIPLPEDLFEQADAISKAK